MNERNSLDDDALRHIEVPVHTDGKVPLYATKYAAGADLCAQLHSPLTIQAGDRVLVPTNTYMAIPVGYEGQVRPRSGLSIKHGITIINSPGTIDSDYRGEIKVPIINMSDCAYTIHNGDKIAQLVIAPYVSARFVLVSKDELSQTERGSKGFGSTDT